MLEQQLAEWLRAIVDDEPPLAPTPDELVDRLRGMPWWRVVKLRKRDVQAAHPQRSRRSLRLRGAR